MQKEFNILLRHRIPFLTRGTWGLIGGFLLILFLLWLFMLPANNSGSSLEMRTAYYILAVPEWLKYLSSFSILSLLVLIPLSQLRLKIPSSLFILDDHLSIQNKRLEISIQFAAIKGVFVNDLTDYRGEKRYKLQIAITYSYDKTLTFFLTDYEDSDELMESMNKIDPDKFAFFDKNLPAVEDEI